MKFHLTFEGNLISVELISRTSHIFSIEIPGQPVFFITLSKTLDNSAYWTSIPQGNEKLANEIGPLIEEYMENNKKTSSG